MKKIYSLLAAGALFAAGATHAQEGPSVSGSHDMMMFVNYANPNLEAGPGILLKLVTFVNEENQTMIDTEESAFSIYFGLKDAPPTFNELPGNPFGIFFNTSFHEVGRLSGFGRADNLPYDEQSSFNAGTEENPINFMPIVGYPNDRQLYSIVDGDTVWSRDIGHVDDFTTSSDSINTLIDLVAYENADVENMYVEKADFVEGQQYGFFYEAYVAGVIVDGEWTEIYEDVDPSNNLVVLPLTWTEGVSIGEMIKEGLTKKIVIFPNPVQDEFNFDHIYVQKSENVQINIVDITGKLVHTQNEGAASQGNVRYNVKTNNLPAGTYIVQLVTDNYTATSKFVKQ